MDDEENLSGAFDYEAQLFAQAHGLSPEEARLVQDRDSLERERREQHADREAERLEAHMMLDQLTAIADRLDSGTPGTTQTLARDARAIRRIRDYFRNTL